MTDEDKPSYLLNPITGEIQPKNEERIAYHRTGDPQFPIGLAVEEDATFEITYEDI